MKKLLSFLTFSFLALALVLPSSVFAAEHSWSLRGSSVWLSIDSGDDGSNIILGAQNGYVYTSDDGGATLVQRDPTGGGSHTWVAVASDADGSNLIAAYNDGGLGRLYTSSNGGANWTERQPAGDVDIPWSVIASDADGSNLVVAANPGRVYTSVDSGANWTEPQPGGDFDQTWVTVASDADGSNLIIAPYYGRLYTTSNGGANWTERQPRGNISILWTDVATDDDGSNLIVSENGENGDDGQIHTSSNGGANWTERQPAGAVTLVWQTVASDADGSALLAGVGGGSGGRLYSSDDSGASWDEEQPAGDVDQTWYNAASDSDGSHLVITTARSGNTGQLYTAPDTVPPTVTNLPDDDETEVALDATFDIGFSEGIATSTGNITLHLASDDSLVETIDVAGPKVTRSDAYTLTLDPTTALELGTEYYFLADAGIVEDANANPFAGISDPTVWNFTSDSLPQISSFTPLDDAVDVPLADNLVFEFDQDMQLGTGSIVVKKVSDDSTVRTIDVPTSYNWDGAQTTVAFSSSGLENSTEYYVLIDSGAFEDTNGNPFAGISDPTTWNFTTEDAPPPPPEPTFDFERVNVSNEGVEDDSSGYDASLSGDGRYVVFNSGATTLVPDDTNGWDDVFVYDRDTDTVERVSVSDLGEEGDSNSQTPSISSDGRYVAFRSITTNLIPDDTNDNFDVFVYDRDTDTVERVSVNDLGEEGDGGSYDPAISDDGRYVAFYSDATNLVSDDTNGVSDVFVYDRDTDTIERVSLDSEGGENIENTFSNVQISGDGNFVSFGTSGLLVPEAIEGYSHLYLFDRDADTLEMIDKNESDEEGNSDVGQGLGVSDDGRYVAFSSSADNLVSDDTEGVSDIFVLDRETGVVERITSDDTEGFYSPALSSDGRYVAFEQTTDEGEGDMSGIYRYDRNTDTLLYITEGSLNADEDGGGSSYGSALSDDGSVISFTSNATNLVEDDTNGVSDVFVWDESLQEDDEEEEQEEPEDEGEEEDDDSGSSSSHRHGGGGGGSSNDDSTLLASLEARVQELKTILASLLGSSSTTYTRDLTLEDTGPDVTQLQLFLIAQNKGPQAQALAVVGATGFFGPLTQSALAEYQASVGITPATGFLGPVTRAYINGL